MSEELSKKQALFVAEYLVDLNAGQAAIRAGYSRGDARNAGYRLLRRPKIQEAIAEAQAPRLARLKLDADAVLVELARIARANVLDCVRFGEDGEPIVDLSQLDHDQAAGLSELTIEEIAAGSRGRPAIKRTRFRMHDKLAALDKLARHFGLMREPAAPEPVAPPAPQHSTRQVARAVIQILETARLEDEEEEEETELETGLAYFDRTPLRSSSRGTMS